MNKHESQFQETLPVFTKLEFLLYRCLRHVISCWEYKMFSKGISRKILQMVVYPQILQYFWMVQKVLTCFEERHFNSCNAVEANTDKM